VPAADFVFSDADIRRSSAGLAMLSLGGGSWTVSAR
jgi:hypothetical protein